MAEIQPLRALRYEPAVAGALGDVVAPPYDVIDAEQRAALVARSPYNVVHLDLPEDPRRRRLRARRRAADRSGRPTGRSCATTSLRCGSCASPTPVPTGAR